VEDAAIRLRYFFLRLSAAFRFFIFFWCSRPGRLFFDEDAKDCHCEATPGLRSLRASIFFSIRFKIDWLIFIFFRIFFWCFHFRRCWHWLIDVVSSISSADTWALSAGSFDDWFHLLIVGFAYFFVVFSAFWCRDSFFCTDYFQLIIWLISFSDYFSRFDCRFSLLLQISLFSFWLMMIIDFLLLLIFFRLSMRRLFSFADGFLMLRASPADDCCWFFDFHYYRLSSIDWLTCNYFLLLRLISFFLFFFIS